MVKISVQAEPRDAASWVALARRLEQSGFEALLVGDHPGSGASPWPALGAAAAATSTLNLGTYVLQAGVRSPLHAAADAATLDTLAPGRVLLGVGAGHTFREWEVTGRTRPSAADRAARLGEFVDAVRRLLAGESVTVQGEHIRLVDARLADLPTAGRVRIAVGVGGNRQNLRLAAARADVVALSGLGRTLPDGHRHDVRWRDTDLQSQLALIEAESRRAATHPEVEALVQTVVRTDERDDVLRELAARVRGMSPPELGRTPFVLVGTRDEMADQLRRQADEYGITRYVVREGAVDAMERVLAIL